MSSRTITNRYVVPCIALALLICAGTASAQVTINFDETGVGTIARPGATTITLTSLGNQIDPFDPGSGLHPLTYDIFGSIGATPVSGDVQVSDNTGTLSDLLRFENGRLLVYSDRNEPGDPVSLADVGLPGTRQNNVTTLPEFGPDPGLNGIFGYTPSSSQPGAFSAPVIYNFTSDTAVPEPSSFAVVGLGALLLLCRRRRPICAKPPSDRF